MKRQRSGEGVDCKSAWAHRDLSEKGRRRIGKVLGIVSQRRAQQFRPAKAVEIPRRDKLRNGQGVDSRQLLRTGNDRQQKIARRKYRVFRHRTQEIHRIFPQCSIGVSVRAQEPKIWRRE